MQNSIAENMDEYTGMHSELELAAAEGEIAIGKQANLEVIREELTAHLPEVARDLTSNDRWLSQAALLEDEEWQNTWER